jgi:hypothetical protein
MKLVALLALAMTLFANAHDAADKGYGVDPNGFTVSSDVGCGIDPNGCNGSYDGGGAMDPNGYSACLDPNG